MLTRAELREMRALTKRVLAEPGSREDWANLAALTLIREGDETCTRIAAQGFDHFHTVSEPIYARHAFQRDDFKLIYRRVCQAAERAVRDLVH